MVTKNINRVLKKLFYKGCNTVKFYFFKIYLNLFKPVNSITTTKRYLNSDLIVSLTTYSHRIHDVHLVIESLSRQTSKANRVILWLDEDEFSLDILPQSLLNQVNRGLEIKFCPNYRSYKKLIPTLMEYSNINIITVDDDVIYPTVLIERFLKEHDHTPDAVLANRVHKIELNSCKGIESYSEWSFNYLGVESSYSIFPVGIGGIFYPAGILSEECLNVENFMSLAPSADDVWFKAMSLLNEKKCKRINSKRDFFNEFYLIENNQYMGLFNENVYQNKNDIQIKNVLNEYGLTQMFSIEE